MFKFIIGVIVGVVLTITIALITNESDYGLEYDPDFDDYEECEI